jgi:glycosyltransferase involved in cell wall biosynthesis
VAAGRDDERADDGCVIWASTALDTKGGVASCVRTLAGTSLYRTWSVCHIPTHRDGSPARKVVTFARAVPTFLAALAVRRPDLVHLHTASYGSFLRKATLAALARLARVPVVLHVHGAEFHLFHDHAPRSVQRLIRSTLTGSAVVLALGDLWAERLRRIAPNARVMVVPNPVTAVGPASQPAHGDPVQVVFLGEIGDRKGTFTLLDAWAKVLVEATSPVRLTIAGAGEIERARRRVRELGLFDTVTVRPWLAPGEVAGLLATSQVLCLPSRDEGQPMAVLEAMANGLCVVAGNVGGIPEMLADGCGLLVPPDSVDELAAALGSVVDDPLERARLGGRALRRVRSTFDTEVVRCRIDALYREVIGR